MVKVALLGMALLLVGCMNQNSASEDLQNGQVDLAPNTQKKLGPNEEVTAVSRDQVDEYVNGGAANVSASEISSDPQFFDIMNNDLLIGLSRTLMNKSYHWGAGVIGVQATKNQGLSMLKLAATPSFNVTLKESSNALSLVTEENVLVQFPVLSKANNTLLIDVERLGANLNLFELLTDEKNGYQVVSNRTVSVNYVAPNLVFDVETAVVHKDDKEDQAVVMTRWYLTEDRGHSRHFRQRMPTAGVGHFLSKSSSVGTVRAFDIFESGRANLKVYAKNFPDVMKISVERAMKEWNDVFQRQLGVRPIKIEYIDVNSPLSNIVMAGDPRFNVIEWDLFNVARYEGFGPCVNDRSNGKIMGCSAMIQGPAITYRTANAYKDPGLLARVFGSANTNMKLSYKSNVENFELSSGKMKFEIHAFNPELRDEHIDTALEMDMGHEGHEDHESEIAGVGLLQPPKMDSLVYLQSYIQSVIAHEFGHNLGLRHNFKGSMFANASRKSASVMDYLFTYTEWDLKVEEYDEMALAYAYAGKKPAKTDMFCTDHQVYSRENPRASVECRRFDFTAKPLNFYLDLINTVLEKSVDGSANSGLNRTANFLNFAFEGLVGHAVNAVLDIPTVAFSKSDVTKEQILSSVNSQLRTIKCKYSEVAGAGSDLKAAQQNISILDQVLKRNTSEFVPTLFPETAYNCQ